MNTADTHIEVAIEDQVKIKEDLKEAVARADKTTAELQSLNDKHEEEVKALKTRLAEAEAAKLQADVYAIQANKPYIAPYQYNYYPYTQYYIYPSYTTTTIPNTWGLTYNYQTTNTLGYYSTLQ
jgi:hypothetical protein